MKKTLISFFIILVLIAPALSFAAPEIKSYNGGIVPCDGSKEHPCDFNAFMSLINNIINFAIFYLAVPIATIMFAYAGFLMVTAGEEAAGARTTAKGIFMNTLTGLVIALLSWVVVHSLLEALGYKGSWIGL